jgi:hypothetical protein
MDHQHTGAPALDSVVIDEIAGQRCVPLLVVDPLGFHGSLRRAGQQNHGSGGQDEKHETCDSHWFLPNAFAQLLHCRILAASGKGRLWKVGWFECNGLYGP